MRSRTLLDTVEGWPTYRIGVQSTPRGHCRKGSQALTNPASENPIIPTGLFSIYEGGLEAFPAQPLKTHLWPRFCETGFRETVLGDQAGPFRRGIGSSRRSVRIRRFRTANTTDYDRPIQLHHNTA